MSARTCPKCLGPRAEARPLCKSCALIEQGLIRKLGEEAGAANLAALGETDKMDYATACEFEDITKAYGDYVLPDTAHNGRVQAGVKDPRKNPPKFKLIKNEADIPQASAVPSEDDTQRKVLEAHQAWMSMETEALDTHHRRQAEARRVVLLAAVLAGIGGFAIGAGLMSLIFFLTTGGLS